jgi:hypothetical protein
MSRNVAQIIQNACGQAPARAMEVFSRFAPFPESPRIPLDGLQDTAYDSSMMDARDNMAVAASAPIMHTRSHGHLFALIWLAAPYIGHSGESARPRELLQGLASGDRPRRPTLDRIKTCEPARCSTATVVGLGARGQGQAGIRNHR